MFQEFLQFIFDYDPSTGRLHYKKTRQRIRTGGKAAGTPDQSGYIRVSVFGKRYTLHRLVWVYHYGDIPKGMLVDHINRNVSDNRIENLRVCTHVQNLRNRTMYSWNTSGYVGVEPVGKKGVAYRRKPLQYRAIIWNENKRINLGKFPSFEEAKAARIAGEIKYGYRDDPRVPPPDALPPGKVITSHY